MPPPGPKSRASRKPTARQQLQLLFTCVGRRIELMDAFRRAGKQLGIDLTLHGADVGLLAPAMHAVDRTHIVPAIKKRTYISDLLRLVARQKIDAIIPLIDSDLLTLARASKRFAAIGCRILLSDAPVIEICRDKILTYQALKAARIDTPTTWTWEEALKLKRHRFPYYMKPREGSAGLGNYRINNLVELKVLGKRVPDPIVQEFVEGSEYTLDVYVDLEGQPRCAVPRRRIEVRSGEVSKGIIVKDPKIINLGMRVADSVGTFRGVVTIQCMAERSGRIRTIEINPRFGGGAPLAICAGANFPKWLMAELLGKKLRYDAMGYKDGITMLRYDQSIFLNGNLKPVKQSPRR